jgi:hypothetical protein
MKRFLQFDSGALAQYPFTRRWQRNQVESVSPDGHIWSWFDAGSQKRRWTLSLAGLTAAEKEQLETLFVDCQGKLQTFVFLDPAGNLLRWSTDLEHDYWVRPAPIAIAAGFDDPEGGSAAFRLTNTSQTALDLSQVVSAPGEMHYSFSVSARSANREPITLFVQAGSFRHQKTVRLNENWTRLQTSATNLSPADSVEFGVAIPAGSVVDIFGPQAEAQPCASTYRRTTKESGVYSRARFDQDELTITAHGPDEYSTILHIIAPVEE